MWITTNRRSVSAVIAALCLLPLVLFMSSCSGNGDGDDETGSGDAPAGTSCAVTFEYLKSSYFAGDDADDINAVCTASSGQLGSTIIVFQLRDENGISVDDNLARGRADSSTSVRGDVDLDLEKPGTFTLTATVYDEVEFSFAGLLAREIGTGSAQITVRGEEQRPVAACDLKLEMEQEHWWVGETGEMTSDEGSITCTGLSAQHANTFFTVKITAPDGSTASEQTLRGLQIRDREGEWYAYFEVATTMPGGYVVSVEMFDALDAELFDMAGFELKPLAQGETNYEVEDLSITVTYEPAEEFLKYRFIPTISPERLEELPDLLINWTFAEGDEGTEVFNSVETPANSTVDQSFLGPGTYTVKAQFSLGLNAKRWERASTTLTVVVKESDFPSDGLALEIRSRPTTPESACQVGFAVPALEPSALPERFTWRIDPGDGSPAVERTQTRANFLGEVPYHYVYRKPGNYTLVIKVLDENSGTLIAEGSLDLSVDDLQAITRTQGVRAVVNTWYSEEIYSVADGVRTKRGGSTSFGFVGLDNSGRETTWQGRQFTSTWVTSGTSQRGDFETTWTMTGTVSEDGSTVESLVTSQAYRRISPETGEVLDRTTQTLTLRNVPLTKSNCGDAVRFRFYLEGSEISRYVPSYEFEEHFDSVYDDGSSQETDFVGFAWTQPEGWIGPGGWEPTPTLEVEFKGPDLLP